MKRVWVRFAMLAVVVAGLAAFMVWFKNRPQNKPLFDIPPVSSKDYVAAIMETPAGDRVVSISPSGAVMQAPVAGDNIEDQQPVWKPDGRRIFFISNRGEDQTFQIWEWLPDRANNPSQLTPNGASRSNVVFTPGSSSYLYTSRGAVMSGTYPKFATERVMPPSDEDESEHAEEGSVAKQHTGQTDEVRRLISQAWSSASGALEGEAFERGTLDRSGRYFIGIYNTARGQALVIQDLQPTKPEEIAPFIPMGGDEIKVQIHPTEAKAVVTVTNFRYPAPNAIPKEQIGPDGKAIRPFVNAAFVVDLRTRVSTPIFFSKDGKQDVTEPALSPNGREVALIFRRQANGDYKKEALLIAPVQRAGIADSREIAVGNASEPSWSPDGSYLVYVRDGKIFRINSDGSNERVITQDKGVFRSPKISPMR